eukprot:4013154-Prymnesium_polylepis.1
MSSAKAVGAAVTNGMYTRSDGRYGLTNQILRLYLSVDDEYLSEPACRISRISRDGTCRER